VARAGVLLVWARATRIKSYRSARLVSARLVVAGAVLAAALAAGSSAQAQCVINSQTLGTTLSAPAGGCIENYGTVNDVSPGGIAYGIFIPGAGTVTNFGTSTGNADNTGERQRQLRQRPWRHRLRHRHGARRNGPGADQTATCFHRPQSPALFRESALIALCCLA
jgi:hypothetical protein